MIILSGVISGIAFSIRFQAIFMLVGFGVALLCMRQFRNAILWGIGAVSCITLIQGGIDMFIWGRPFAELGEYVRYNMVAAGGYLQGSPLMYVYLILGLLIPPVSIFLFWGFFARWRKYLLLFLPSFIFLIFHSIFINKQERFILTIIPFVVILGMLGWSEFLSLREGKKRLQSVVRGSWKFFVVMNAIALCFITAHYSHKARVEAMLYLSKYKNIEQIAKMSNVSMLPLFYLGQWIPRVDIDKNDVSGSAAALQESGIEPRFILLVKDDNAPDYLAELMHHFPDLVFETEVAPSLIDNLMYVLNPRHNKNEAILIYRNQKLFTLQ